MSAEINSRKKNKKYKVIELFFYTGILVCYCFAHVYLSSFHEAWRDEAQAWVLAKNASFPALFEDLCVEGHPALWFLLCKIFSAGGLSFYHFSAISIIFMTLAAGIVLFFSPFCFPVKLSILLSSLFCYTNPVICRVYCVVVFLVVIIAALWEKREEKPILYGFLIFLLLQSHIIMAGMGCVLLFVLILDYINKKFRKQLIGILIGFSGVLLTLVELYPRSSAPVEVDSSAGSIFSAIQSIPISRGGLHTVKNVWPQINSLQRYYCVLACVLLLLVMCTIITYKHDKSRKIFKPILVFLGATIYIFAVDAWVYAGTYQMSLCLLAVVLFFFWTYISDCSDKKVKVLLSFVLVISMLTTSLSWIMNAKSDKHREYSGSYAMSEYISRNLPIDSVILATDNERIVSVYAYVNSARDDILFYDLEKESEFSYFIWGLNYSHMDNENRISESLNLFDEKNVYYISCDYDDLLNNHEPVFTSGLSSLREECYNLYQLQ